MQKIAIISNSAFSVINFRKKLIKVVYSTLKKKNSNIGREKKGIMWCLIHTTFMGIPHFLITHLTSQLYRMYGVTAIDLENIEREVNMFIDNVDLHKCESLKDLPLSLRKIEVEKSP